MIPNSKVNNNLLVMANMISSKLVEIFHFSVDSNRELQILLDFHVSKII